MARERQHENGVGPNRQAIEELVAELSEEGRLRISDGPLIAQARSLASAVDANPASSQMQMQMQMQYAGLLRSLRAEVMRGEREEASEWLLALKTGCDTEAGGDRESFALNATDIGDSHDRVPVGQHVRGIHRILRHGPILP